MKKVIVIGGGIGGLAAAVRLARQFHVTLLEKNDRVGGKLNLWQTPHPRRTSDRPFRFDTGPSLLTMPYVFMDLFAAAGADVRDYLTVAKLDPVAKFFWADGTTFELRSGDDELHREISRVSPGDAAGWARLLEKGQRIWNLAGEFLSHAPDQMPLSFGLLTLPLRIGMFSNFARAIDQHVKNQKLRDVLYQYATYAGASPFRAAATLTVIPWVEHYFGGWHIEGGMYRLAEQLELLAKNLGVDIRTNCPVEKILLEPICGRKSAVVRGVMLADGTQLPAEAVIANSDAVYTYRHLIESQHRRRYDNRTLDRFDPGGSGVVLMLGIDGTYPQLEHHNKFMPKNYRAELDAMFESHALPSDPCIYVCRPTKTDSTLAPPGCDTLFVLASAPSLKNSSINWQAEGPRYRDQLIRTLEQRWGLTDLSRRIVVEKIVTPLDLQHNYNANFGSIYGIAGNSLRSTFLRPLNRDKQIEHLYLTGGATHPGGGLPLVALSGKIAAELLVKDLS